MPCPRRRHRRSRRRASNRRSRRPPRSRRRSIATPRRCRLPPRAKRPPSLFPCRSPRRRRPRRNRPRLLLPSLLPRTRRSPSPPFLRRPRPCRKNCPQPSPSFHGRSLRETCLRPRTSPRANARSVSNARSARRPRRRPGNAPRAPRKPRSARRNSVKKRANRRRRRLPKTPRRRPPKNSAAKAAEDSAAKAAASAYRGLVIGHLAGFKRYPPAARARGAQGSPAVSFSIDASGHVISVSLTRASGDPDIDAEIVAMVHRASPFPAPPPGAPHVFTAGVNFRLQ